MIKLFLATCGLLIILFSCKYDKTSNVEDQNKEIFVPKEDTQNRISNIADSIGCKDRLREMVISCGSGYALNLKENNFELQQKNTYKITFCKRCSSMSKKQMKVQLNITFYVKKRQQKKFIMIK